MLGGLLASVGGGLLAKGLGRLFGGFVARRGGRGLIGRIANFFNSDTGNSLVSGFRGGLNGGEDDGRWPGQSYRRQPWEISEPGGRSSMGYRSAYKGPSYDSFQRNINPSYGIPPGMYQPRMHPMDFGGMGMNIYVPSMGNTGSAYRDYMMETTRRRAEPRPVPAIEQDWGLD